MKAKKLAKLIGKAYLKFGKADEVNVSIVSDNVVKVVERFDTIETTYYLNLVGDDIIVYCDDNGKVSDKIAISAKDFKKFIKIICSIRNL